MNSQLKSTTNKATGHVAVTLVAVGCILAIPSTTYLQTMAHSPVYIAVGIVVFIGCLAYLLLIHMSIAAARAQAEATAQTHLLANILFLLSSYLQHPPREPRTRFAHVKGASW